MRRKTPYAMFLIGLAACTAETAPYAPGEQNPEISLYSEMSPAAEGDTGEATQEVASSDDAVFLFWDFGDILSGNLTPAPLFVKMPEENISSYARPNAPYNTGERYPDGNRRILATGYAPSTLEPDTREDGSTDYERLSIPESGYGITDILTSVEPIVASAALPFDRDNGETLEFMHAQSQVSFAAKLDEYMGKYLQNVRIKLDPSLVATRVEWNRDRSMYIPMSQEGSQETYTVEQTDEYQLTKENPLDIGMAYIVPEKTALPVTITVERSESSNGPWEDVTFSATLLFSIERDSVNDPWDEGKNDNTLYANEAYKFTIVFGEEGIELVGRRCKWENGGYIIVPIYPLPEEVPPTD